MTPHNSHLIVVGSGIAGLYSALLAAEAGLRVTLVTKGELVSSNTFFAQGGICAVLEPESASAGDSVEAHIADTLKAGAGQCDPEAVRILCTEAREDISALERFGVSFDRDVTTGQRSLGLEGAHSAARILHSGGDATGAGIAFGLIRAVRDAGALRTIHIREYAFMSDLMVENGRVVGVALRTENGPQKVIGDAVLLATGGAGQLFEFTTNPSVATADGVAVAWRAGAELADTEFYQFHPTALAVGDNFLLSEAVRGVGAVLRDRHGERFMPRYHPDGDLASRDIVSRSIAAHLNSIGAAAGESVFLDATGVESVHGAGYLARRFPTIDARTRELGFDWRRQWLPVSPAAHYWMGGIATDSHARTSLPGLYAAGEVACTGVHGANRLASNSLLEGLVFGRRAVAEFLRVAESTPRSLPESRAIGHNERSCHCRPIQSCDILRVSAGALPSSAVAAKTALRDSAAPLSLKALQRLMDSCVGSVRDAVSLQNALDEIETWHNASREQRLTESSASKQDTAELENLLVAAWLMVHAALSRKNSVGAHYRSDFPQAPAPGRSSPAHSIYSCGYPAHVTTSLPVLESETV
ncbi:L-aspartate oxidase [Arthrobacter cryoconiti]|uniref:L-aspartate oxidase n=1 Tax=Arthrobacter cryoconiti TaxID=748907 RepID=A0ABV8QW43_9MICC|nr:FAD-dependent oxidoreductase [Arthrobacter cryoconiti]MCC9068885.1 FAD-dependent oxidoreductase [Arthrobacter cryoconiti]